MRYNGIYIVLAFLFLERRVEGHQIYNQTHKTHRHHDVKLRQKILHSSASSRKTIVLTGNLRFS